MKACSIIIKRPSSRPQLTVSWCLFIGYCSVTIVCRVFRVICSREINLLPEGKWAVDVGNFFIQYCWYVCRSLETDVASAHVACGGELASWHFSWTILSCAGNKRLLHIIFFNFKALWLFNVMELCMAISWWFHDTFKYVSYCIRLSTSIQVQKYQHKILMHINSLSSNPN